LNENNRFLLRRLVACWAAVAMAIAAANWAVITWLKWELSDFLTAVCAGPITLEHLPVASWAIRACWTAGTVTITALHLLAFTRLERKFRYLLTAVCTGPVTLHHWALTELAVRTAEHV